MKSVFISIKPQWCELIAKGEKTLEVRKTRPKMETPFKCYIYRTKGKVKHILNGKWFNMPVGGSAIGEFICDDIRTITASDFIVLQDALNAINGSCISPREARSYAGWKSGSHILLCEDIYGWHITDLKIYDKPKELTEFTGLRKTKFGYEPVRLKRPPQSWCYVEEVR